MNKDDMIALVEKAQSGNKQAFERLYTEFGKRVYFTALKIAGNEADAEDILQDTFLTASQKITDLKFPENFGAWITRIAVNKCNRFFLKTVPTDENEDALESIADDDEFIPDNYVDDKTKRKIIMDIIDSVLTPLQRQTVILFYFDGLSTVEIAKVTNSSTSAVKARLNAARAKIKEAVLIYEEKNKDRLHAIVPIPVLARIFEREAEEIKLPKAAFASTSLNVSDKTNTNGGKVRVLKTVKGKILLAGAVGAIAVGGAVAVNYVNEKNNDSLSAKVSSENNSTVNDNNKSNSKITDDKNNSQQIESENYDEFLYGQTDKKATIKLKKDVLPTDKALNEELVGNIKDICVNCSYISITCAAFLDKNGTLHAYQNKEISKDGDWKEYSVVENSGFEKILFAACVNESHDTLYVSEKGKVICKSGKGSDSWTLQIPNGEHIRKVTSEITGRLVVTYDDNTLQNFDMKVSEKTGYLSAEYKSEWCNLDKKSLNYKNTGGKVVKASNNRYVLVDDSLFEFHGNYSAEKYDLKDIKVANFWDDGLDFHRFGYFTDEQNNFYCLTNKGPEQIQYPFEGTIDCILGWSYKSFILKSGDNWYTYSVGKFINSEGKTVERDDRYVKIDNLDGSYEKIFLFGGAIYFFNSDGSIYKNNGITVE